MDEHASAPTAKARLWDAPTRIVHWSLIVLIGCAWWAADTDRMDLHRLAGYAVLALLVFRLAWGVVGSHSARFASFVKGPTATLAYLRSLPSRAHADMPGHNPLGAWSVLAILVTLVTQVVTGLFSVDVDGMESGPLADRVSFDTGRALARVHHLSFSALEALVVLHLAAIVFYAVYKRADLVRPMLTGRRRLARDPELAFAPVWLAALVAAAAAFVAWWAAQGLHV